ncbi:MAG: hypothetical protein U0324_26120 [Polyangiales bacterium]
MRRPPVAARLALPLALCLAAAGAGAQSLTDAERAARADLVTRAQAAQRAGRFEEALHLVERAERIGPTAGTRLVTARILVDAGRHVAALESAGDCLREVERDTQTTAANRGALRAECESIRAGMASHVARVTVRVPAGAPPDLVVRVAGAVLIPARYGAPQLVEAGDVVVSATSRGGAPWTQTVTIAGGGAAEVELPAPAATASPALVVAPHVDPPRVDPARIDPPPAPANVRRTLGVAGLVAGGAALVGGVVATALFANTSSSYESDRCVDLPPSNASCVDRFGTMETLQAVQWAAFVGGGLLAAAGAALFLTAPSRAPAVRVSLSPGGASVGYAGQF